MKKICLILILALQYSTAQAFDGMSEWTWQQSQCQHCGIYFETDKAAELELDDRALAFKKALQDEKQTILDLYQSDPQEYNLLAWMALGILGNESNFYTSGRYKIKEALPWMVTGAKIAKSKLTGGKVSSNSRGPTQIKNIPDLIESHYQITAEDLENPRYAAVTTVAFLIEALEELKQRKINNNLVQVEPATYVDFLPYIYFGKARSLVNRTATPEKNIYVQNMKKHMQKFKPFEVYF